MGRWRPVRTTLNRSSNSSLYHRAGLIVRSPRETLTPDPDAAVRVSSGKAPPRSLDIHDRHGIEPVRDGHWPVDLLNMLVRIEAQTRAYTFVCPQPALALVSPDKRPRMPETEVHAFIPPSLVLAVSERELFPERGEIIFRLDTPQTGIFLDVRCGYAERRTQRPRRSLQVADTLYRSFSGRRGRISSRITSGGRERSDASSPVPTLRLPAAF